MNTKLATSLEKALRQVKALKVKVPTRMIKNRGVKAIYLRRYLKDACVDSLGNLNSLKELGYTLRLVKALEDETDEKVLVLSLETVHARLESIISKYC